MWISETKRIKRTEGSWEKRWLQADFSLNWTAEMFAYVFAAARAGVRHMITDFFQDQPSHHTIRLAPVIHYSLTFKLSSGLSWGKGAFPPSLYNRILVLFCNFRHARR